MNMGIKINPIVMDEAQVVQLQHAINITESPEKPKGKNVGFLFFSLLKALRLRRTSTNQEILVSHAVSKNLGLPGQPVLPS